MNTLIAKGQVGALGLICIAVSSLDAHAMDFRSSSTALLTNFDQLQLDTLHQEVVIPEEQMALEIYRSTPKSFTLVSDANCTRQTNGALTDCEFPVIELAEISKRLPPLPYETVVRVNASRSCRYTPVGAVARMQLGKYGDGLGNDADEASLFLRDEDLKIDQNQKILLTDIHQAPLGSLSIAPKAPKIFLESKFPRGCEISIQVELNRIAIRSQADAEAHISNLRSQLNLIRDMKEALTLIQSSRNQRKEVAGNLIGLQSHLERNCTKAQCFQIQWNDVKELIPAAIESVEQQGSLVHGMNEFLDTIAVFDEEFSEALVGQDVIPRQFTDMLSMDQRNDIQDTSNRMNNLLQSGLIQKTIQRVEDAELQFSIVENSLAAHLSDDYAYQCMMEELSEEISQTLSGPHGTIDELIHGFHSIGTRVQKDSK